MEKKRPTKIMDTNKAKRREREERRRQRRVNNKTGFVRGVAIILIVALLGRVGYIKVVKGAEYEKQAVIQPTTQINEQILTAQRGEILDRTGKPIAISSSVYKIFADIIIIDEENNKKPKVDLIDETANALFEVLEYPKEDFKALFAKDAEGKLINNTNYLIIETEVPYTKAKELRDKSLLGIHLEEDGKRVYPYNDLASQTIGFISGDSVNDYWGLENQYNDEMTGTDGRYFVSYDNNNVVKDTEIDPIKGNSIVTTLDLNIQQFTDDLVDKYGIQHGATNVSIIVMKPQTGEIIAMSEYPHFDNNFPGNMSLITDPTFAAVDEALPEEKKGDHIYRLWKNFSVSNTFEPGSIFKPITVATALEENVISPTDTFYCPGYKTYPDGTRVKCWIFDSTGAGHGKVTVEESLAQSCNVAMMEIGAKMGRDTFSKYQQDFGFGTKTGIDLPGEEDAKDLVYSSDKLNEVELGTGAFGQGFNSTVIQDIVAVNAVINGGYIVKPYLVSEILGEDGSVITHNEPVITRKVISKETSDIVRNQLEATVLYGTGAKVAVDGYSIGGKTGTAEQIPRGSGKYALSFVGYLPVNNPEYIALGVINEPNDYITKHTSAVPMMHEVFEKLINYYNIPTDKELQSLDGVDVTLMNDYSGSVVSAVSDLNKKGYSFQITGSGDTVYKQNPKRNQPISPNTNVFLFVKPSSDDILSSLVEVPSLENLELSEAEKILEELGFVAVTTPDVNVDDNTTVTGEEKLAEPDENKKEDTEDKKESEVEHFVTKQMPTEGVSLPKGTEIRLIYK